MNSQPERGRGTKRTAMAAEAGSAAVKGGVLIGVAILLGVVLLQITDDGSTGAVDKADGRVQVATTTTGPDEELPDTTFLDPVKAPDEIRVLVLNGGAPAGAAGAMSDVLSGRGYTNQEQANDWESVTRTGNMVTCRDGLEREGATLAIAVGDNTPTEQFPDPAPPFSDEADCVVIAGLTEATPTT